MHFEFDPKKSAANMAKHGISFESAQSLWVSDLREVATAIIGQESRTVVTGSINGKLWTAVVTYRKDATRIISCRRANHREELQYHGEHEKA